MDRSPAPADGAPLTAEEYEAVRHAVSATTGHRAGGEPYTLNSLFESWRNVVTDVEEGYAWCAPEFDAELRCRHALAGAWRLLPPRVRVTRLPELAGLDDRFRAATVPWPGRDEDPHQWWRLRVPRILEAERGERRVRGWPVGWEMLPFPKPDAVEIVE
ncbi:hypothetical protein ACH5AO_02635 [Streptomyces sp. NPDC018964]|uniref:hypothetical protein n=1 Tax=unclassified Streptomyces TaxID=2593676 RepID=UPI00379F095C